MNLTHTLQDTLRTAGFATAATTIATTLLGTLELGHPVAPLNATSHVAWGDEAAKYDAFDARHTLVGAAIHSAAMVSWAAVQHTLFGSWARRGGVGRALLGGGATAVLAYVTDYHVVPARLTPGFEKRLSRPALAAIYGVLALSLAAGLARGSRTPR